MKRPAALRVAGLVSVLGLVGCSDSSSPTGPTAVSVPPSVPAATPVPTPTARPSAAPTPSTLEGAFRLRPDAGPDGVIRLQTGESLVVNANDYARANPNATLALVVNWGDGQGNQRVGCGPCRLDHKFAAAGRFTVEATIDDGVPAARAMSPVTRTVTVVVEAAPTPPPAPGSGAPSASFSSGTIHCPSLSTTILYKATDPEGEAMTWIAAVNGGTLTSPASGGPVASGDLVTVDFTGTPGTNTVTLTLTDPHGVSSVPTVLFGPLATCGGQTIVIKG